MVPRPFSKAHQGPPVDTLPTQGEILDALRSQPLRLFLPPRGEAYQGYDSQLQQIHRGIYLILIKATVLQKTHLFRAFGIFL